METEREKKQATNPNSSSSLLKQSSENYMYAEDKLGPVVQSIVSLTSSLRGQLVKCFTTF